MKIIGFTYYSTGFYRTIKSIALLLVIFVVLIKPCQDYFFPIPDDMELSMFDLEDETEEESEEEETEENEIELEWIVSEFSLYTDLETNNLEVNYLHSSLFEHNFGILIPPPEQV